MWDLHDLRISWQCLSPKLFLLVTMHHRTKPFCNTCQIFNCSLSVKSALPHNIVLTSSTASQDWWHIWLELFRQTRVAGTIQMHLIACCITTESSASIACWYQSQHYMIRFLQPHSSDTVSILVVYKDTSCIIQQSLKDLMIAVDWLCPWLESLAIMLLPGAYLDVWFDHIG